MNDFHLRNAGELLTTDFNWLIGDYAVPWGHKLKEPHDILARSIWGLDLRHLIADIQCEASVRYNDPRTPSTRQQAYAPTKPACSSFVYWVTCNTAKTDEV